MSFDVEVYFGDNLIFLFYVSNFLRLQNEEILK